MTFLVSTAHDLLNSEVHQTLMPSFRPTLIHANNIKCLYFIVKRREQWNAIENKTTKDRLQYFDTLHII